MSADTASVAIAYLNPLPTEVPPDVASCEASEYRRGLLEEKQHDEDHDRHDDAHSDRDDLGRGTALGGGRRRRRRLRGLRHRARRGEVARWRDVSRPGDVR